ncbi:MAG: leucine-rich repeat domain-containing protein, partial [Muribaculaceae bacterium]|nr:leucine-rich repeat domain-containing protein [Muribaculaceae bacterium]
MKRWLSLLLLLIGLNVTRAAYSGTATIDQVLSYSLNSNNTATLTGCSNTLRDLVIPSTIEYAGYTYTVTEIRNSAFANCYLLESISIPASVTSIGSSTSDYSNLPF